MDRYAAFLRGINLGKRRVTGAELCAPFEQLGYGDVTSFLASGNVVFTVDHPTDPEDLTDTIASALEAALGYEVLTFLRNAAELADIAAREPFTADQLASSTGKPQVMLLPRVPDRDDAEMALAAATDDDVLVLEGRELHWLPAGGVSQSELDHAVIGRAVGPVTIRTANTLQRMHTRFFVP